MRVQQVITQEISLGLKLNQLLIKRGQKDYMSDNRYLDLLSNYPDLNLVNEKNIDECIKQVESMIRTKQVAVQLTQSAKPERASVYLEELLAFQEIYKALLQKNHQINLQK